MSRMKQKYVRRLGLMWFESTTRIIGWIWVLSPSLIDIFTETKCVLPVHIRLIVHTFRILR